MAVLWLTTDCRGRPIELSDTAWQHVCDTHPEVQGCEKQTRLTVEAPNVCTREADGSVNYYRLGGIPGRPGVYLHVVARDYGDKAVVHTAWAALAVDPFEEFLCVPTKD